MKCVDKQFLIVSVLQKISKIINKHSFDQRYFTVCISQDFLKSSQHKKKGFGFGTLTAVKLWVGKIWLASRQTFVNFVCGLLSGLIEFLAVDPSKNF